ncbi:MAG: hypothetical protein AAGI52_17305, partial [Bacteroidota bacterium]
MPQSVPQQIIVTTPEALRAIVGRAVAEAVEDVTSRLADDAREIRRGLLKQKGLLSATEAGELLGVSAYTIRQWVRE